jgi:hypothetical protein
LSLLTSTNCPIDDVARLAKECRGRLEKGFSESMTGIIEETNEGLRG